MNDNSYVIAHGGPIDSIRSVYSHYIHLKENAGIHRSLEYLNEEEFCEEISVEALLLYEKLQEFNWTARNLARQLSMCVEGNNSCYSAACPRCRFNFLVKFEREFSKFDCQYDVVRIAGIDPELAEFPGMLCEGIGFDGRLGLISDQLDEVLPAGSLSVGQVEITLNSNLETHRPQWSCMFRGKVLLPVGWANENPAENRKLTRKLKAMFPIAVPQAPYYFACDASMVVASELVDRALFHSYSYQGSHALAAAPLNEDDRVELAVFRGTQSQLSSGILLRGLRFEGTYADFKLMPETDV